MPGSVNEYCLQVITAVIVKFTSTLDWKLSIIKFRPILKNRMNLSQSTRSKKTKVNVKKISVVAGN